MGYYTQYNLTIAKANGRVELERIDEDLRTISGYNDFAIDAHTDTIKWYDHDKDMIELSKKHPNILFQLDGEGEESGDIWRSYYCNGEVEFAKAVLTFPSINFEKMFAENATTDRTISDEEYKNAQDEIIRAEQIIARAADLVKRYNEQ